MLGVFKANGVGMGIGGIQFFGPGEGVLLVLFGVALGFGGSLVSVGRHLKNV